MSKEPYRFTIGNNTYAATPKLMELLEKCEEDFRKGNVIYFPNSWIKKICRSRGKYPLFAMAGIILKLCAQYGNVVMLPRKKFDVNINAADTLPVFRRLLEMSTKAQVPYDGLGSRSVWRRALQAMERHKMVRLIWRQDFVTVVPVLTKAERAAWREGGLPPSAA
jgi:hypothetical protein